MQPASASALMRPSISEVEVPHAGVQLEPRSHTVLRQMRSAFIEDVRSRSQEIIES